MGAKRQDSEGSHGSQLHAGVSGARVPLAVIVGGTLFVAIVFGIVYGWRQWGRAAVARPIHRISAESIQMTPPPHWIHTDVRAEIVRDGALSDLTIFDKDATIRVYQAFELHPWVSKVLRVSKHPPARLMVEVEYRQPIAWVEVPAARPGEEGGVIPVDLMACVLPSRDFTKENLKDYLRISIKDVQPYGLAGAPWGDSRVVGAVKIAAALQKHWQSLGLFRIQLASYLEVQPEPVFELETIAQQRIVWGNAPGMEAPEEPSAAIKRERLVQLFESAKSIDQLPVTGLDLRDASKLRTALRN